MKKANLKKIFAVLLSFVLIAVIALTMQACTSEKSKEGEAATTESPVASSESTTKPISPVVLGEGETQFIFDVYHKDGSLKKFNIHTDKETVGEALVELKIIDGEDGSYGLYVKTVDSETLDFDIDKMYWSFYEDGKYAQKGVDQTKITDGVVYAFKAEK